MMEREGLSEGGELTVVYHRNIFFLGVGDVLEKLDKIEMKVRPTGKMALWRREKQRPLCAHCRVFSDFHWILTLMR